MNKVIEDERNIIARQFKKNGIDILYGVARFENPHMLIVMDSEYRLTYQIKADKIIIATGSKPRTPTTISF